ncbi:MAG: 2-hydroxychromene-2-carboxylate isomerase [Myxococcota bacterium]
MEFYFDYLSPYAYLAWHAVRPIAEEAGRTIEPKPVLLAGLLGHWGQLGPAEIEPKRIFTFKDALRRAADDGMPLRGPKTHPFNPLTALRVSLPELAGEHQAKIIDAMYAASWGNGGEIGQDQGVVDALQEIGLDGADLVARSKNATIKRTLRTATASAVEKGVFGVPTVLVDGELFFGRDRLEDVRRFLRGEDPITAEMASALLTRGASAERKR